MQQNKRIELMVGSFIVISVIAILVILFKVANISNFGVQDTYSLKANFDNIGTLKVRSPVKVGGVVVGRVTNITLDKETYIPVVTMDMDKKFGFYPETSSAQILTAGLIGEQYVSIEPGFVLDDTEMFKDGDTIEDTKSAIVLENLIGQFLFSLNKESDDETQASVN